MFNKLLLLIVLTNFVSISAEKVPRNLSITLGRDKHNNPYCEVPMWSEPSMINLKYHSYAELGNLEFSILKVLNYNKTGCDVCVHHSRPQNGEQFRLFQNLNSHSYAKLGNLEFRLLKVLNYSNYVCDVCVMHPGA